PVSSPEVDERQYFRDRSEPQRLAVAWRAPAGGTRRDFSHVRRGQDQACYRQVFPDGGSRRGAQIYSGAQEYRQSDLDREVSATLLRSAGSRRLWLGE